MALALTHWHKSNFIHRDAHLAASTDRSLCLPLSPQSQSTHQLQCKLWSFRVPRSAKLPISTRNGVSAQKERAGARVHSMYTVQARTCPKSQNTAEQGPLWLRCARSFILSCAYMWKEGGGDSVRQRGGSAGKSGYPKSMADCMNAMGGWIPDLESDAMWINGERAF